MADDAPRVTGDSLTAIYTAVCAKIAAQSTLRLWQELAGLENFMGGSQHENLRLAALANELAGRDDDGDPEAAGARAALENWKTGPADGGDTGHIAVCLLKIAPTRR